MEFFVTTTTTRDLILRHDLIPDLAGGVLVVGVRASLTKSSPCLQQGRHHPHVGATATAPSK
ncbi:hypothetical protein ACP70R_049268 [Stipagrostis hirtigluma subsp. patula]